MTILNWEFIQQYLPLYEKAAWLTLRLGVMGILLSIAVGLACAVIQYEKIPVLRRVVADGTRSVLFSTHITSDLEKCATHIAFIKDGELQYTGSLDDFRTHYKDVGATLEDIIVHVERRPLDEDAII